MYSMYVLYSWLTSEQDRKSQSPTRRYPLLKLASAMELMPTSTTTAPGFSQCPWTYSGRPIATITISASFNKSSIPRDFEWTMVTVASFCIASNAVGMPTMLERPIITTFLDCKDMSHLSNNSMTPCAVQLTWKSSLLTIYSFFSITWVWVLANFAKLHEPNPSTSFNGWILSIISLSIIWFGRGSWTRIPLKELSSFKSSTAKVN